MCPLKNVLSRGERMGKRKFGKFQFSFCRKIGIIQIRKNMIHIDTLLSTIIANQGRKILKIDEKEKHQTW